VDDHGSLSETCQAKYCSQDCCFRQKNLFETVIGLNNLKRSPRTVYNPTNQDMQQGGDPIPGEPVAGWKMVIS